MSFLSTAALGAASSLGTSAVSLLSKALALWYLHFALASVLSALLRLCSLLSSLACLSLSFVLRFLRCFCSPSLLALLACTVPPLFEFAPGGRVALVCPLCSRFSLPLMVALQPSALNHALGVVPAPSAFCSRGSYYSCRARSPLGANVLAVQVPLNGPLVWAIY